MRERAVASMARIDAVVLLLALAVAGCTSNRPPAVSPVGSTPLSSSTSSSQAVGLPASASVTPSTRLAPDATASPPGQSRRSGCVARGADPDPACTPGSLNPAVTQATVGTTICEPGYTTRIRPPVGVTERLKVLVAASYGYGGPLSAVEGDHYVPLEIGGSPEGDPSRPDDTSNFWDEPHALTGPDGQPAGSFVKDGYENWLHGQVCAGKLSLADAQRRVLTGWYESFVADGRP